jgi:hypothetical protein
MAYRPLPDFESFWTFSNQRANDSNDLSHHLCCDVWTTRHSKRSRNSHTQETKWRTLLASLDPSAPDKKTALRTKMLEEGWRIPVLINKTCLTQPPTASIPQFSSDHSPSQNLPRPHQHSGAFTFTQLPIPTPLPTNISQIIPPQNTCEQGRPLDTVSLYSLTLPARSVAASQEWPLLLTQIYS